MADVIVYVPEDEKKEVHDLVERMACQTGAIIFSEMMPFVTTHIVCTKETL